MMQHILKADLFHRITLVGKKKPKKKTESPPLGHMFPGRGPAERMGGWVSE